MTSTARKILFRFETSDDIFLLKEVCEENPYQRGHQGWLSVAGKCSYMGIDARRARERTSNLVEQFRKDDREALSRSGTEEEYTEKTILLQEISDLIKEADLVKSSRYKETEKRQEENRQQAIQIREKALDGLKDRSNHASIENDTEHNAPKKRKRSTNGNNEIIQYLISKMEGEAKVKDQEIKLRQELELEKEKLKLDRDRFKEEKKERFRLEREERLAFLEI